MFKAWYITPVQLDRHSRAVCLGSLRDGMADVPLFLGLLYHVMTAAERGRAVASLSLSLTMDAGLLAAYISVMQHKGSALSALTRGINHPRKVLDWLAATVVDLHQGRWVEQVADGWGPMPCR